MKRLGRSGSSGFRAGLRGIIIYRLFGARFQQAWAEPIAILFPWRQTHLRKSNLRETVCHG